MVVRYEKTSCPADSKRTDAGNGYKTVADAIEGFVQLGQLPTSLSSFVGCWDDGDGICDTFARHRAPWHIECKQHFVHGNKLDRLRTCTRCALTMLHTHVPQQVAGDGNCRFRARSWAQYDTEDYYELLRLKTALELLIFPQHYDDTCID